ncbi:hypothetical protein SscP1EGY_53 [Streptomyces phage SscP1EGY]|nr:hypothetical protein SscP1EGY_53 [Streptomyces phage SscP1EGY]
MFTLKFKKTEPTSLEVEIERILAEMKEMPITDENYATMADRLVQLYKLKEVDSKKLVSPDAMVGAATNLAGILLILNYEHAHVMTSKAVSFVMKNLK